MRAECECYIPLPNTPPGKGRHAGFRVWEHGLELSEKDISISTSSDSALDNFPADQVEHLSQGIIAGEAGLVPGNLAELAVEALNDISRVYDFSEFREDMRKRCSKYPNYLPSFSHRTGTAFPTFL